MLNKLIGLPAAGYAHDQDAPEHLSQACI